MIGIEPPLPGYEVEVLQWEVPVSRDGRTAVLNGTVQQVYQQLLEINPNYEAEFGTVEEIHAPALAQTDRPSKALDKQDTWSDCGRFDPARADPIWAGIDHLNHVSGTPWSGPGPRACSQVSCSYNSAIWWCNDVSCGGPTPSPPPRGFSSFDQLGSCFTRVSDPVANIIFNRIQPKRRFPRSTRSLPPPKLLR